MNERIVRHVRAGLLRSRGDRLLGTTALAVRAGDGLEFSQLRGYAPGDDPRRIDWAATARSAAVQTRTYFEERGLVFAVAIDGAPSMRCGGAVSQLDRARDAAGAWFSCVSHEDRCAVIHDRSRFSPAGARGAAAVAAMRHVLAAAPSLRAAATVARRELPRGAALLLVSDFFDGATLDSLATLSGHLDVTALVVGDPWGGRLPLRGPVWLRDAASGRRARMYFDEIARRRYRDAVHEREAAIVAQARRLGARAAVLAENVERALLEAFSDPA